jgi:hypothetical protein
MPENLLGQMTRKLKDFGVLPLVLAKCFIADKEIDDETVAVDRIDPI